MFFPFWIIWPVVTFGAMNWIPSLILKKIIPAFTRAVWGSTRGESTSMDMEPTAKTPTGGKGSFACGRTVKAAWSDLSRCGTGFFSRKAGTSGESCAGAALGLFYPFTSHLRPSCKETVQKKTKKKLLYKQVNCNYCAVLGSQGT